jgi:hypothetical protein
MKHIFMVGDKVKDHNNNCGRIIGINIKAEAQVEFGNESGIWLSMSPISELTFIGDEQSMDDKIQLTKDQAIEILNNTHVDKDGYLLYEKSISDWKEKGWIKQSALEEARDEFDRIDQRMYNDKCARLTLGENSERPYHADIIKLRDLYEKAIKELKKD